MRQREHRSCWARRVIPLGVSQDPTGRTLLRRRRRPAGRKGALLSAELLFAFPVLAGLLLGIIEFGMLLAAEQRVETACREACRVGSLPASDSHALGQAVRQAAEQALASASLVQTYTLSFQPGQYTGDPVMVQVSVPMRAAAPDLLLIVGFGLTGRQLNAQCVMRKE